MSIRRRDRKTVEQEPGAERARQVLGAYHAQGVRTVSVTEVLELLGTSPEAEAAALAEIDPDADPMTGCLPVTAPQK